MTSFCSAEQTRLSRADYEAAVKVLFPNLKGLVRNESVTPHWIGSSGRFWYTRDGANGTEFVVVNVSGDKSPAFDHERVNRALSDVLHVQPSEKGLSSLIDMDLSDDLSRLTGKADGKQFECNVPAAKCFIPDAARLTPSEIPSSDGRLSVLTRDHNLFLKEVISGKERQLTSDGEASYAWAKQPDFRKYSVLKRRKTYRTSLPFETYLSPDSRYLISPRVDERRVGIVPYVEWVPSDGSRRPIVHEVRLPFPGDPGRLEINYYLFDLLSGKRTEIRLPDGYQSNDPAHGIFLGWNTNRGQAFLIARTAGWKAAAVFRMNLATGSLTKVVEESSTTRVELSAAEHVNPDVRVLGDGAELIWTSDRTGWQHYYLYDAKTGRLKNAITSGNWRVLSIQAVDEVRREVYFTGLGREPGRDPYYRHLYRASLDGPNDITLLTDANAGLLS